MLAIEAGRPAGWAPPGWHRIKATVGRAAGRMDVRHASRVRTSTAPRFVIDPQPSSACAPPVERRRTIVIRRPGARGRRTVGAEVVGEVALRHLLRLGDRGGHVGGAAVVTTPVERKCERDEGVRAVTARGAWRPSSDICTVWPTRAPTLSSPVVPAPERAQQPVAETCESTACEGGIHGGLGDDTKKAGWSVCVDNAQSRLGYRTRKLSAVANPKSGRWRLTTR